MALQVEGGCRCRLVRYECVADPIAVTLCYCRDCIICFSSTKFPSMS